jgi:hypothetical protein
MYTKSLLAIVLFSAAVTSADSNLPVLFQFSQPGHNVAVYRGADLQRAKAAGLFGGLKTASSGNNYGAAADSSSYTTPAPPPPTTQAPTPAPYTPAPYTPSPVVYKPAPIVYKPQPIVYRPAPVAYKPAPVVYKPAPVVYKPAPVVYKPAPAPVVYKPAPAPYHPIPAASYQEPEYAYTDAAYTWEYAVKDDYTRNDFGAKESRQGALTNGKYYVSLPDGRLQTVTYTVDGYNGYVPVVEYSGEPTYPEAKPVAYAPAKPAYA